MNGVGLCSRHEPSSYHPPNGRVLRHPGDLEWLERRRLQAADLLAQRRTRAEVAGELGVSAQTASRWYARWRGGGVAGMRTARHGKPAQLGPAELAKLRRVLDRGAVAAGVRQRPLDPGARRHRDRAGDRGGAPSRSRVAPPQEDAVEPAAPGP